MSGQHENWVRRARRARDYDMLEMYLCSPSAQESNLDRNRGMAANSISWHGGSLSTTWGAVSHQSPGQCAWLSSSKQRSDKSQFQLMRSTQVLLASSVAFLPPGHAPPGTSPHPRNHQSFPLAKTIQSLLLRIMSPLRYYLTCGKIP